MWSPTTLSYKRANPSIQPIAAIRQFRILYFYFIKINFSGKSMAFQSFHIILTIFKLPILLDNVYDDQTLECDKSECSFWVRHMGSMSRDLRFPTMWYVRPAKAQTSLIICAD